jgi:hypothetical protein
LYSCINTWRKISENMLLPSLVLPSSNSIAATISSSFIAYRNQNSNLYNDDVLLQSVWTQWEPPGCMFRTSFFFFEHRTSCNNKNNSTKKLQSWKWCSNYLWMMAVISLNFDQYLNFCIFFLKKNMGILKILIGFNNKS